MSDQQVEFLEADSKIISLEALKQNKEIEKSLQSYADYLSLLEIHQIVTEAKYLVKQIQEKPLVVTTIKKCELLVQEISKRLNGESPTLTKKLTEIRDSLANKIHHLF